MRTRELIVVSLGVTCAVPCLVCAQGTFQNLDFESASLSPLPENQWGRGVQVSPSDAMPGWTGYVGADQVTYAIQNAYSLGQAEIDIFGPNYTSAITSPGYSPGLIDGNYSILLQAGGEPGHSTVTVGASIAQSGTVPLGTQLLEFRAWQSPSTVFTVSFDDVTLTPFSLGTGANYTLYGVDISPYAGESGQLEFTADFVTPGTSWLGLDDIAFTQVPEPSPVILTGIGGTVFALYQRFRKKSR